MKIGNVDLYATSFNSNGIEIVMSTEDKKASAIVLSEQRFLNEVTPSRAIESFPWIKQVILGRTFATIEDFDQLLFTLDATSNKRNLGANVILALSICFTKLFAQVAGLEVYEIIGKLIRNERYLRPLYFFNTDKIGRVKSGLDFLLYVGSLKKMSYKNNDILAILEAYEKDNLLKDTKEPVILIEDLKQLFQIKSVDNICFGIKYLSSIESGNNIYKIEKDILNESEFINYIKGLNDGGVLFIEDIFSKYDKNKYQLLKKQTNDLNFVSHQLTEESLTTMHEIFKEDFLDGIVLDLKKIGSISEAIQIVLLARRYKINIHTYEKDLELLDDFIIDWSFGIGAWGIRFNNVSNANGIKILKRLDYIEKLILS